MNVEKFYRENYSVLQKKLRRFLQGSDLEVEDVIQNAFVHILTQSHKYDPAKGKEGPWINRLIFNTMWNAKRKKRPVHVDIEGYIDSIEVSTTRDKDVKSRILNVVDDEHKAVLFAIYLLNYSKEEVAKTLKIDKDKVREIVFKYQMDFE